MKRAVAVAVTVLISVLFAVTASALELPYTLEGKVVAVDPMMRTVTLQTTDPLLPSTIGTTAQYTFILGDMASILMCDQDKTLGDVKAGDRVEVNYHEKDGNFVADTIVISTPILACLNKGTGLGAEGWAPRI